MASMIRSLLLPGVAVPFLYYGIQAAAAPFFPGFTITGTTASELGSDLSSHPGVFYVGIMTQGVCSLLTSIGFLLAMLRLGVHPVLAIPTAISVAMNGVQTLWAGYFPLPDPRHGGHPAFQVAMLSLPPLLTVSLWKLAGTTLKTYFLVNLALLACMVPLMTGMSGVDTHAYRGLLQRVFALTVFVPIGVGSAVLLERLKSRSPELKSRSPEVLSKQRA